METVKKEKSVINTIVIKFDAISQNESFARIAVSAFAGVLNPTVEEISDIKTAVSEAVTNCIIHGYENRGGVITMELVMEDNTIHIMIQDEGVGIANVMQAMEPLYTSKPELERSGMGFSFMEAFMDDLHVFSEPGEGTVVRMSKSIGMLPRMVRDMDEV